MKNILVHQDKLFEVDSKLLVKGGGYHSIVAVSARKNLNGEPDICLLTDNGVILFFHSKSEVFRHSCKINSDKNDREWFNILHSYITGLIVCISHSGTIACVRYDEVGGIGKSSVVQVVAIDGGILTAQWNPDQSSLLVATQRQTLMLMSNAWQVMREVCLMPTCVICQPTSLSWRGDGEYFSFISTDSYDNVRRVRLFDKQFQVKAVAKNVIASDAHSGKMHTVESIVLRGLGSACSFSTIESLVAVSQQKGMGRQQIVLLDGNGLVHESFDINLPLLPTGCMDWEVNRVEWDMPSTILAVGLRAVPRSDSLLSHSAVPCFVQLYLRNTYYWYAKHQWSGNNLQLLGFDSQVVNRLYMSQGVMSHGGESVPAIRVVDVSFDNSGPEPKRKESAVPIPSYKAAKGSDLKAEAKVVTNTSSGSVCVSGRGSSVAPSGPAPEVTVKDKKEEEGGEVVVVPAVPRFAPANHSNTSIMPPFLASSGDSIVSTVLGRITSHVNSPAFLEAMVKRQKPNTDEKAQRCRDRNRIDARNTRNRKKLQFEELLLRAEELKAEKHRLSTTVPPEQNDIASILISFANSAGGGTATTSTDTEQLPQDSSTDGQKTVYPNASSSSATSAGGFGGRAASFDSATPLDAIVQAAAQGSMGSSASLEGNEDSDPSDDEEEDDRPVAASINALRRGRGERTQKELEDLRKERNRIHAKKARARKKKMLIEVNATIAKLESEIAELKYKHGGGSSGGTRNGSATTGIDGIANAAAALFTIPHPYLSSQLSSPHSVAPFPSHFADQSYQQMTSFPPPL